MIASFLLLSLVVAVAPADNAPADKYFGRLKMSALRIRFEIGKTAHLATFAAESYYQWAAQYSKDAWLASTGSNLAGLFADLPGPSARASAIRALTFVLQHFKNTRYSKQAAVELARGVPSKAYPAWAVKLRTTPSPSASPQPSASPRSIPSPTPTR